MQFVEKRRPFGIVLGYVEPQLSDLATIGRSRAEHGAGGDSFFDPLRVQPESVCGFGVDPAENSWVEAGENGAGFVFFFTS